MLDGEESSGEKCFSHSNKEESSNIENMIAKTSDESVQIAFAEGRKEEVVRALIASFKEEDMWTFSQLDDKFQFVSKDESQEGLKSALESLYLSLSNLLVEPRFIKFVNSFCLTKIIFAVVKDVNGTESDLYDALLRPEIGNEVQPLSLACVFSPSPWTPQRFDNLLNNTLPSVPLEMAPPKIGSTMQIAFCSEYKKSHQLALLHEQLQRVVNAPHIYYSPIVTIYQHSGSGKTRAAVELGLTVCPMLYLCFREKNSIVYPYTVTTRLRAYLLFEDQPNALKQPKACWTVYVRYVSFVLASVATFLNFWLTLGEENISNRLATFLNLQMNVSICQSVFLDAIESTSKQIERTFMASYDLYEHENWAWIDQFVFENIWTFIKPYLIERKIEMWQSVPVGRILGLICIDEERIFRKQSVIDEKSGKEQSLSMLMLRACRLLYHIQRPGTKNLPFAVLRMDTLSQNDLVPQPPANDSTGRLIPPGRGNCVYWLLTPRNVGASKYENDTDLQFKVNMAQYMKCFGCPIWNGLARSSNNLIELGITKLCGHHSPCHVTSELTSVALVGAIAHLEAMGCMNTVRELVSSHMAQLQYWLPQNNLCVALYPPDPILAAAASKNLFEEQIFGKHMDNLIAHLDRNHVSSGSMAELLARTMLVKAARVEVSNGPTPAMKVGTFLTNLIGTDELDKAVFDANDASILEGIINVRQFYPKSTPISRSDICQAARCGYAFITEGNAAGFNAVIPVILKTRIQGFVSEVSSTVRKTDTRASKKQRLESDVLPYDIMENNVHMKDAAQAAEEPMRQSVSVSDHTVSSTTTSKSMTTTIGHEPTKPLSIPEGATRNIRTLFERGNLDVLSQTLGPSCGWTVEPGSIEFDAIKSVDIAAMKQQAVRFKVFPDGYDGEYQFSPDYVSYIGVQVQYHSGVMPSFASIDPLTILEPEISHKLFDKMPRMSIAIVYDNSPEDSPTLTKFPEYGSQTSKDSLFTNLLVRNPHRQWKECFKEPIQKMVNHWNHIPYLSIATADNKFSVEHHCLVDVEDVMPTK